MKRGIIEVVVSGVLMVILLVGVGLALTVSSAQPIVTQTGVQEVTVTGISNGSTITSIPGCVRLNSINYINNASGGTGTNLTGGGVNYTFTAGNPYSIYFDYVVTGNVTNWGTDAYISGQCDPATYSNDATTRTVVTLLPLMVVIGVLAGLAYIFFK